MEQHCRDSRFVWNLALEQMNLWRHGRRSVDTAAWDRQLAEARQSFGWLAAGSSSVQQAALRDLRQAFRNWWSRPQHFGRPTWRKAQVHEGFVVPRPHRHGDQPAVGRDHDPEGRAGAGSGSRARFPAAPISAQVTCDRAGRWHVSIVAGQPEVKRTTTGASVGIDLGIAATVTTSRGQHLRLPRLLSPGETQRLRRLRRRLARQTERVTPKGTDQAVDRSTACPRDSTDATTGSSRPPPCWVRDHDLIVIEDLRVRNMAPLRPRHPRVSRSSGPAEGRAEPVESTARRGPCCAPGWKPKQPPPPRRIVASW